MSLGILFLGFRAGMDLVWFLKRSSS